VAGMASVAGLADIAGVAGLAGLASLAGLARVARVARVAGATIAEASVAGASVAGAGVAGVAGAGVADSLASGLIFSANFRIARRRHLTSLQAESLGLLGTPSSILRIKSHASSHVTSWISFQCSSGIVGIGKKGLFGRVFC